MSDSHLSTGSAPASAANRREWSLAQRHGPLLVAISPVVANLIGSAFNIWYNHKQIEPQLSPDQLDRFGDCWMLFNVMIYPLAVSCWVAPLIWLRPVHRALLEGREVEPSKLVRAQRTVINLPWWILIVAGVSWFICIPVFTTALAALPGTLDANVLWHLSISFLTASLIAVTHSFFAVEIVSHRCLFPVFFRRHSPADVPGALPLSIRARGFLWALSAAVAPVIIFELLILVPQAVEADIWFAIAVGVVAIAFSLTTGSMHGRLVEDPIRELRDAAVRVSDGDLNVRVNLLRADDFGPLISRFNQMVDGLRERERLQQTFGRHVGEKAALEILSQGDSLGGSEQEITVMFVDVRNFTRHSAKHSPEEVVSALNVFFQGAVETVEAQGGMVNKFLGDGFMALFGIGGAGENHALQAFDAAHAMLHCLDQAADELRKAGWPGLKIGIGLHSGPAIVGSIGSPRRQEYTAIGDTVNVASRVESLTKTVGRTLLMTSATRDQLPAETPVEPLPPQDVKGKDKPLELFAGT